MFGSSYFGPRYWGARYFGTVAAPAIVTMQARLSGSATRYVLTSGTAQRLVTVTGDAT